MTELKRILVLARRDHVEAMRVAAGLTISGHEVELVFVDRVLEENAETLEQAELLDLAGIEPASVLDDPGLPRLTGTEFHALIHGARHVVSL